MKYFPIFLSLAGRRVAICGRGETAARKARLFAKAGAAIEFFGGGFDEALVDEWRGRAAFHDRSPALRELENSAALVVADIQDADKAALAALGRAARIPVNVVDVPELCDFVTPSIIDRGDIVTAVSTGGAAPVLGRRIREKIEALLPAGLDALAALAAEFRESVAAQVSPGRRRAFWEKVFDGPVAAAALAGEAAAARALMIRALNDNEAAKDSDDDAGVIHLVGAGPGDPDLLTLRALRHLQDADIIYYDSLVTDEILDLARRDAERVFVGKRKDRHALPQDEISRLMIASARSGKRVVRLKGGDPFVFGRGGEELDAAVAAGVRVEATPGVTAATGCAASIGAALTHRDYAQAVTFITGFGRNGDDPALDWSALAAGGQTLAIYMGASKAAEISARLIEAGRSAATPAAIVVNGTRENEQVHVTTLADLPLAASFVGAGPALIFVGEIAARSRKGVRIENRERAKA